MRRTGAKVGGTEAAARGIVAELVALRDPERARLLQRFFRTGPGDYGEGDRFLGLRVPQLRKLARQHRGVPLPVMLRLLESEWHEARLLGLFLMVDAHGRGEAALRDAILEAYLANTRRVSNWDLVDASAGRILGPHLRPGRNALLTRLARSASLWERRIAVIATSDLIRRDHFQETFRVARLLLADPHDLIHKAVGWMLREVGKRDPDAEERFLRQHYRAMPRTMLRYAIERFPPARRRQYLEGRIAPG